MKSLLLLVATFVLTISVNAQSAKFSVLNSKIEVAADYSADTRASRTPARATNNPVASDTQSALDMMGDTADNGAGKKYRLSIELRNDDTKSIRAVTVEYSLSYSRGRKSPERLTFKSKKEIKPAETVTLTHTFITHRYVSPFGEAIIMRIDYADGSVWRR